MKKTRHVSISAMHSSYHRISQEYQIIGHMTLTLYHVEGGADDYVNNFTKLSKLSKSFKLHHYIWNHHGKCIQISTNMPCIGLEIRKIT